MLFRKILRRSTRKDEDWMILSKLAYRGRGRGARNRTPKDRYGPASKAPVALGTLHVVGVLKRGRKQGLRGRDRAGEARRIRARAEQVFDEC